MLNTCHCIQSGLSSVHQLGISGDLRASLEASVRGMSVARRRYAGRRVKDAIAVFEKNKGTIVFTADEAGQAPVKPTTSPQCGPSTATPDPTVRAEGTNPLPGGEGKTERQRSAKVGGWTKEKVYVLELTRDRVQAPGGREGLLPAPAVTSPTVITNQSQERTGDAREDEAVAKKEVQALAEVCVRVRACVRVWCLGPAKMVLCSYFCTHPHHPLGTH